MTAAITAPAPRAGDGQGLQRAYGRGRIRLAQRLGHTVIRECYQHAAIRVRWPRPEPGAPCEAVVINTAGGLTGGDDLALDIVAQRGTHAVIVTQAAEKVYRASHNAAPATMATRLSLHAGARLEWLPQEAILFDGSRLMRSLDVEMAEDAALIAVECVVLGRAARGETVRSARFLDRWRIRRGERLVYAEGLRLDGDAPVLMAARAAGRGAIAMASLVVISPEAEGRIDHARDLVTHAVASGLDAGASAHDGMLVMRLAGCDPFRLRRQLVSILEALRGPLPRAWAI